MQDAVSATARRGFIAGWLLLCALKLALAVQLPLFVDEAFYWQEGQHPAWAYSDLPALTAWLARLGVEVFGQHALGLRLPFLLIGAALPWLVVRMAAREFGANTGWQAGLLALLLPLAGSLGLLALPDVPMLLATLLCLDAGLRLLRRVDVLGAGELALGLLLGGLTHYRFVAVIAVGFAGLLMLRDGRQALRHRAPWVAVAIGARDLGLRASREAASRLEDMSLEDVEGFLIKKALARYGGNVSQAAKALGLSRSALYRRLQRFGL